MADFLEIVFDSYYEPTTAWKIPIGAILMLAKAEYKRPQQEPTVLNQLLNQQFTDCRFIFLQSMPSDLELKDFRGCADSRAVC